MENILKKMIMYVIVLNWYLGFRAGLESPPSVCKCLSVGIGIFLQVHLAWAPHHSSRSGGNNPRRWSMFGDCRRDCLWCYCRQPVVLGCWHLCCGSLGSDSWGKKCVHFPSEHGWLPGLMTLASCLWRAGHRSDHQSPMVVLLLCNLELLGTQWTSASDDSSSLVWLPPIRSWTGGGMWHGVVLHHQQ